MKARKTAGIPEEARAPLIVKLERRARTRWGSRVEVIVRFRGWFAHVDVLDRAAGRGSRKAADPEPFPICRPG